MDSVPKVGEYYNWLKATGVLFPKGIRLTRRQVNKLRAYLSGFSELHIRRELIDYDRYYR